MNQPLTTTTEQIDLDAPQPARRARLFEAGHMKLLVLHLISQSSKHGYDIIKAISDIVGGGYSPSAGTIYPTLKFLEDQQYISAESMDHDRKQYQITDLGQVHLTAQQEKLQYILDRFETRREIHQNDRYLDIHRAMENLKTALRMQLKTTTLNPDQVRAIADKIDHAAVEIGRL